MNLHLSRRRPHHRWTYIITYLCLILWLSPLLPVAPVAARSLPVQPELLEIATGEPDALVDVIVQKSTHDGRVEQQVAKLGGTITQQLSIINGFAAQLPAQAVTALGALPGVRWISLNDPVESHSSAQTRYYLYSANPGADSVSQPVLPFNQDAPSFKDLPNYDTDRDNGPGLLIRRSNAADGTIQRWRMGPFTDDMWLSGNGYLQLYVAAPDFRKDQTVRIQAELLHLDANGQPIQVVASNGHVRKWLGRWQNAQIRFNDLNHFFEAGHYLELALTVDPTSDDDIWVAFGTRSYPSHLNINLQYALLGADTFYLANGPGEPNGDTVSQPVLPITYQKPTAETLYNYDTDRDNGPGLVLQRGGAYDSDFAGGMVQRWRFKPFLSTTQIAPNAQVELYAAVKQFQVRTYGKIWAHLIHRGPNGELIKVIASESVESANWGTTWQRRTIRLRNPTYAIPAGHQLELALTVDADSAQAMWIAYGSASYPARLKTSFLPLLPQYFLDTIGAPVVWSKGYEGQGVRVAVIDSGIQTNAKAFMEIGPDGVRPRIIRSVGIGRNTDDQFGHGTFVAGVIGGNGAASGGYYKGVAPKVDLINVRVSDEWGAARESDVIAGMQWVLEHKDEYDIRVVNMSLNSAAEQPYHLSPLDAAAEILWFNGIVVVVSAGNNGSTAPGVVYPPANDPFVIAVGATDDMETPDPSDDIFASDFSAYDLTPDAPGLPIRPDLSAPGVHIVSTLAEASNFKGIYTLYHYGTIDGEGNLVKSNFVASGTSISSGVVAGAAALLLQAYPDLNPDQVKYLLMASAMPVADAPGAGAGIINVARALELAQQYENTQAIPTVNTGYPPSQLLATGSNPIQWNSVNWNSVNWNSVNWNSVNWNSVNWNSVDMGESAQASGSGEPAMIDGGHVLHPPLILEDARRGETPVQEPETPQAPSVPDVPETPELPEPPEMPLRLYIPSVQRQP